MSNLFSILNLSTQAMFAAQTGVSVTNHNLANVNTPGYSRQRAEMVNSNPIQGRGGLYLGQGVMIANIRSVQDRFLNHQINANKTALGRLDTLATGTDMLQEILNEADENGLTTRMNAFFTSLQNLADHPEGQAERSEVRSKAQNMIREFHRATEAIDNVREGMDLSIRESITEVNRILTQIALLNTKVAEVEGSGQYAGDYRDQRTALLSQLAEHLDFTEFEEPSGMVSVYVAGGLPLVAHERAMRLEAVENPADDNMAFVHVVNTNGTHFDVTQEIQGGKIKGALEIRDEQALDLKNRLDELAYELATRFNAIHRDGYGLDGGTGVNFFVTMGGVVEDAAARLALDPRIEADVNRIAAAQSDQPGDNRNALALADLQTALTMNGGTWTFNDFSAAMVGDVGNAAYDSRIAYDHQRAVTDQIVNHRESIVGVSIEEEMASLVQYQQSYQASARTVALIDEMLDTLMNLI